MALEAVGGNVHMDTGVIKVANFKSGVMTSEVVWRPPLPLRLLEIICTWIPG